MPLNTARRRGYRAPRATPAAPPLRRRRSAAPVIPAQHCRRVERTGRPAGNPVSVRPAVIVRAARRRAIQSNPIWTGRRRGTLRPPRRLRCPLAGGPTAPPRCAAAGLGTRILAFPLCFDRNICNRENELLTSQRVVLVSVKVPPAPHLAIE